MRYRYTVLLERGETEDVWVATVPALPGCATQGATMDEVLARAQEAVEGHVESLRALGEPVPVTTYVVGSPWKNRTFVRLDTDRPGLHGVGEGTLP